MTSNKIKNDKYYTSTELAKYCVDKTKEIIGEDNITEWLEPSGGNGVFLDYLPDGTYSCDIEPEDDLNRVVKQDYLTLDLEYKKGRCIIGNPPFGHMSKLMIKFYKKSIKLGNYISFITPISFKDNIKQVYEYDLLYSEDLGMQKYSDRDVHCCLNIYSKPLNGMLNSNPIKRFKLEKDLNIIEIRRANKACYDYDYAFCACGDLGKEITKPNSNQHYREFYVRIYNNKYKNEIVNILRNVKWEEVYPQSTMPNITQTQVYKYLKEQIPELE